MTDDLGQVIEDRVFNQRDMDRVLVLNERTKRVAEKIVEYMVRTDPYGKAIVFCEDIDHATRMRTALVNEVAMRIPAEAANTAKFVVRITGDREEGKRYFDDFIHPERRYPVVATTSKLLSTGVDVKTCKLVVLDQRIESMIEFKQTVGRGTRIHEDTGKLWFTVMDFKKATELFADPDFDGEPVIIYEPKAGDPPVPPDDDRGASSWPDEPVGAGVVVADPDAGGRTKYVVSGVQVQVLAERVQYLDKTGKLITEALTDYTKRTVREQYATLDDFLRRWSEADRKQAVIDEMQEQGVLLDELREQAGKNLDPFDLICHVVFDRPPLTRRERAEQVKKRDLFTKYGDQARAVLDALLDKYADEGVLPGGDLAVLRVQPLSSLGTPVELVNRFGGKDAYVAAVCEMGEALCTQGAGNAGECYTPRAVTRFAVDMVNPRLGETILDPACGTGGFLTCTIDHIRRGEVKTPEQETLLQASIRGVEKKPLPHLLCVTNMIVHGIDVPAGIAHDNTRSRPLRDIGARDRVDVVVTNPPFGGMEEDGIENNFPDSYRTRETADLFLVLIVELLKPGGRAAVVLPDGTLFGEGVKTRIKERMLAECDLHTIVRLPNGVFAPYTGIKTNVLFFAKGKPTTEVWYYEHPYPQGYKSYSKTKPMRIEEFEPEKAWWSDRKETPHAWKVGIEQIRDRGFNLDIANPNAPEHVHENPDTLLARYESEKSAAATLREQLRSALAEALLGGRE